MTKLDKGLLINTLLKGDFMNALTNNSDFKIGGILKAARLRSGKTVAMIASATDVSDRMVRLWEKDIRGIGRGKGMDRTERVFSAYRLTNDEKEEIIRRISLRKHEYIERSLTPLLKGGDSVLAKKESQNEVTEEMRLIAQLMALPLEKRKLVIQMVNTHALLGGKE